jgi:hypothetical protein
MMSGKTIYISATLKDTVGFIKKRIEDAEGYPSCDQRLTYGGQELERNGTCLGDYIVEPENPIILSMFLVKTFDVTLLVDPNGPACDELEMRATMSTTGFDIKQWIADDTGYLPERIIIQKALKPKHKMLDTETLDDFGFQIGDNLVVLFDDN